MRIRIIRHSKGSHEFNMELRLWELLDEKAEFELIFEGEKDKLISTILTKAEILMLRNVIDEIIGEKPKEKEKSIPLPEKTSQEQFEKDFIQQRDSRLLGEKEDEIVPGKRRDI